MPGETLPSFRDLFYELDRYQGHLLYRGVLTPWIDKARPAVEEFSRFRNFSQFDFRDEPAQLAMWNLYALSRANDLLLLRFQGDDQRAFQGATLHLDEYVEFCTQLGFGVATHECFSPFHHEIVRVLQSSDDDEPIVIRRTLWPGLMWGEMLFSRSGVEVIAGRRHALKEVAEASTLYFSYRRLHRRTDDLSVGWGSNSQWRTNFRRDYQSNGMRYYHVDGKNSLNVAAPAEPDRDGLTPKERIELCRNRCFVVTTKNGDDLWPYDDRYEEPVGSFA